MADERDPKLSQRYRELGSEEPSRELDQTILAAAHRAADKPHAPLVAPAGRHRWYFSLAAAAILVLAVALTVQLERQQPDPEAVAVAPAPAPSDRNEGFSYYNHEAPPPVLEQRRDAKRAERQKPVERSKVQPGFTPDPAPQPAESALQERDSADVARSERLEARQQQGPSVEAQSGPAPAPSATAESRVEARPTPAPAPSAADPPAPRGLFGRSSNAQLVPPGTAPAPQVNAPDSRVAAVAVPLTPERLLERIAELRKEGRHSEADQLLAEFRQRYPDYRISEEMLQKVERKK
jgi:hypothetical protein